jgi:hypothetical protein
MFVCNRISNAEVDENRTRDDFTPHCARDIHLTSAPRPPGNGDPVLALNQ